MSTEAHEVAKLRYIYGCIIQGYTPAEHKGEVLYIRHFSPIEQAEVDEKYLSYFEKAKAQKLPTELERLKLLELERLWLPADESDLTNKAFVISSLTESKKVAHLPSQMDDLNRQIQEAEKNRSEKLKERAALLGMTCEVFASQKLNEIYIQKSLYKDRQLSQPLFDSEEFEELDRDELTKYIIIYNERIKDFCESNIRKVALASFFQSYYDLCDDNIFHLFGKPIVSLTFYQSELAGSGKFFKPILRSDNKPPKELLSDPDKLVDWYVGRNNAEKMIEEQKNKNSQGEGGGVSIVGAKNSDLEAYGLKPKSAPANSIQQAAAQKQGSLGMEDFLAMSGIKMAK